MFARAALAVLFLSSSSFAQGDAYRCVQTCQYRGARGECLMRGEDFCGVHAACVLRCQSRGADGTCKLFGDDLCGADPQCVPVCEDRKRDGSCGFYGADRCFTETPLYFQLDAR